jgi:hypothetical protein
MTQFLTTVQAQVEPAAKLPPWVELEANFYQIKGWKAIQLLKTPLIHAEKPGLFVLSTVPKYTSTEEDFTASSRTTRILVQKTKAR